MFLEQIFELIGLGSSGRTCAHITGYFRDSTVISLRKIFECYIAKILRGARYLNFPYLDQITFKI